jgi:hypothetical protein
LRIRATSGARGLLRRCGNERVVPRDQRVTEPRQPIDLLDGQGEAVAKLENCPRDVRRDALDRRSSIERTAPAGAPTTTAWSSRAAPTAQQPL